MAIIIKKFGGTSVGSIELIRNIAKRIATEYKAGEQIVIVVSAMGKTTDEFFAMAYQISKHPSRRELDMLLTAGERITMSLLSLSLQEEGFDSISFTGSQSGIITDDKHGNARILSVNAFRILEELNKGKIVIVAGFQGVSKAKEITTLGRGGSDTTAVALACYLNADKCEIYTDVDGVYSADPRIVEQPHKFNEIDYPQMLALAYNGSKVLHPRAVEFGYCYNLALEIKSSFTLGEGTTILNKSGSSMPTKELIMEDRKLSAIAHKENLNCYWIDRSAHPILSAWIHEIFKYQLENQDLRLFIEAKYDEEILHLFATHGIKMLRKETDLGFVILVGIGINLDLNYLAQTLKLTEEFGIKQIQESEQTIELMLDSNQVKDCVKRLHNEFFGSPK